MTHNTIASRGLSRAHWTILVGVGAAAVLVGIVIGQGLWFILPAIALMPLLWRWPVEISLGGVAILLPFEGISAIGGGQRGPMTIAFILSIWVVFAVGISGGRLQRPSATALWCGAFVAWAAATLLWAADPKVVLDHLSTVVGAFLFFLVASSLRVTEKEFNWLIVAVLVGGAAAALYSLYQFQHGMGLVDPRESMRATLVAGETIVNPNRFAVRMLLPLSFALARFLTASTRLGRFVGLVCAALAVLTLLFTGSRGTVVAAAVLVAVFVIRLKMLRALIPFLLLAAALTAATPSIIARFQRDDRGAGRFDILLVGWELVKHFPVTGAGLSNFPVVYNDFAGMGKRLYMKEENDSHNIYLEVAVEEGLIGLFLFGMALKTQFGLLSLTRRQLKGTPPILAACEAAFCGMLVAGFFGNIMWDKPFWMAWTLLAFAITLQRQKATPALTPLV
jgi:O-antigen ligase